MFVTVIFNVEYMDITSRKMWYLKNLFHCKENGWILITHDYIRKHFEELQSSITDRFIDQFEMRRFSLEEVKDVEQYFVSDELFDGLEKEKGSRTEMLFDLNMQLNTELDQCLQQIFIQIQQRHPNEKIDGIFHCLEGFECLRKIADDLHCPLINYSFSAFRKVHGYRQTLYFANLRERFWDDKECAYRYNVFLQENNSFPVFTNQELITMIGKEHTLPLIQLMKSQPKYEMGVCCECFSLLPQVFNRKKYTDDDIFYECKKLFGSEKLKVRSHAAHLNDIQVGRDEVHNDPVSTILSCKRVTAVQSQILLKALLWGRTTVTKTNCLAFTYLCENDYASEKVADLKGLNYFIFGYLIPSDLMFSDDYWKWRLSNNPTETEICWRHLDFLFKALGINKERALSLQGKERFRYLLETRGCDKQLMENLLSDEVINNINWDIALSQYEVLIPNGVKTYWRIDTENADGSLTSKLSLSMDNITTVKFYPLYDVAGFAKLNSIKVNGKEITFDRSMAKFQYMPKDKGCFVVNVDQVLGRQLDMEWNWTYCTINDYLNQLNI